jgi:hypothetical protein
MNNPVAPMDLGGIFEKTFTLIGKTFVRNLIIALLFLAIPLILMAIAADSFYSSLSDMQETFQHGQMDNNFDTIMSMLGTLTFFGIATLVLMLGMMFAEIAISIVVSEELNSRSITFKDAIDETFRGKWLYGIGQALLKIVVFVGGVILVGIVVAMLGVVSKALMGLVVVLLLIVLVPLAAYVVLKWYFSLTAVAVDDLTVMESLKESWNLITGYWWRTFGILFLFSLITQFVITIVSLPITFGSMWDVYKEYFTMLGKTGGNIDPAALKNFESFFGPGVSISTGISSLLTLLIAPVYTVVMYFDLRARNKAMTQPSPAPIMQDASSETPMDFNQM